MADVNTLVARLVDSLASHLYALAEKVSGDTEVSDMYMDAADALMDVLALWDEEGL